MYLLVRTFIQTHNPFAIWRPLRSVRNANGSLTAIVSILPFASGLWASQMLIKALSFIISRLYSYLFDPSAQQLSTFFSASGACEPTHSRTSGGSVGAGDEALTTGSSMTAVLSSCPKSQFRITPRGGMGNEDGGQEEERRAATCGGGLEG